MTKTHFFVCDNCHNEITHESDFSTGYGVNSEDQKVCYACCAISDKKHMLEHGRICLYLTFGIDAAQNHDPIIHTGENGDTLTYSRGIRSIPKEITNWPGSLRYNILSWSRGSHNWAIPRYDVWFIGPDDQIWYGRHQGINTQLIHCKKTKHTGYAGDLARRYNLSLESDI